jgi:Ca-activated chloride channel family protein
MGKCTIQIDPARKAVVRGKITTLDAVIRITPEIIVTGADRPQLRLALVIDRSGSMQGRKLKYAKQAAEYVVSKLGEQDMVGLVTYDDKVDTLAPMTGIRGRNKVLSAIGSIREGGRTDLHSGWVQGGIVVAEGMAEEALNRIILLSDGMTNAGEVRTDVITKDAFELAERGISTTTVGVGMDYNEDLMSEMARHADGNYWFIQSPEQLPTIFDQELKGLTATVGTGVVLTIETSHGYTLVNSLLPDGESSFRLPNLMSGVPVDAVIRMNVDTPADSLQGSDDGPVEIPLLAVSITWIDAEKKHQRTDLSATILVVDETELTEYPLDEDVRQRVALHDTARLKKESVDLLKSGQVNGAKSSLARAMALLGTVRQDSPVLQELESMRDLNKMMENQEYSVYNKMAHYQSYSRHHSHGHGDLYYRMGGGPRIGNIADPPSVMGAPTEAIVSSTDPDLLTGGAIAKAIQRAAGPELIEECRAIGRCAIGSAVVTNGYKLPVDYVIHTVCPTWLGGGHGEESQLENCYRNCLIEAAGRGIRTVAFPPLGIGGRGFPTLVAVNCAVKTVAEYLLVNDSIQAVQFLCPNEKILEYYAGAFLKFTGR